MEAKRYQAENALLRAHSSGDHAEAEEKARPRVATLPPCPNDMDLMIEAKDKEQAVFELMRTFKSPGSEKFSDIIPTFETMITSLLKQRQRKRLRRRARKQRQRMN